MDEALQTRGLRRRRHQKGCGVGRGCPLPHGEKGCGEEAVPPSPEFFFAFGSQNGEFWCILGRIFIVELLVYRLCYNITPVCVTDSDKPNE